jgi:hypothetical protein
VRRHHPQSPTATPGWGRAAARFFNTAAPARPCRSDGDFGAGNFTWTSSKTTAYTTNANFMIGASVYSYSLTA